MSFLSFIKSKTFWINMALGVVAFFVLLALVNWLIGLYTTSGRTIVMPDLKGHTQVEMEDALSNNDLHMVLIDSVFNTNARPGVILDQVPKPGKKVKKGRTVYITINAWSKELTKMPVLLACSYRNAIVKLETAGLRVGVVTRKPSQYGDNEVLEVSVDGRPIAPNAQLPKGTAVDLVLSVKGSGEMAPVPDITGKTLYDAQQTAANAKFSIGTVIYDETVKSSLDSSTAIVFRQAPSGNHGEVESILTPINVWLSTNVDKIIEEAE